MTSMYAAYIAAFLLMAPTCAIAEQAVVLVPQSVLDQYTPEQRAEAERIARQYGIPFVVVKDRHHTPHRKEK